MERVDTTIAIDTPERVAFRHRVAGPGPRAMAWALDTLLQAMAFLVVVMVAVLVGVAGGEDLLGLATGSALVAAFVLSWFYGATFEAVLQGRTPGKVAMGLRVVRSDGAPVDLGGAVLRNVLRGADSLPGLYLVGVLISVVDPARRRLGDLVAGTMVVREDVGRTPMSPLSFAPLTATERAALPAGRLRLRPGERALLESVLHRCHALTDARGEELAKLTEPWLGARMGAAWTGDLRSLERALMAADGAHLDGGAR